jgi:hypothetical protein
MGSLPVCAKKAAPGMTEYDATQAQARAERLADLVEDTELRRKILRLAGVWRQAIWDAASGASPEGRSFQSEGEGSGAREPPRPSDPTDRRPAGALIPHDL